MKSVAFIMALGAGLLGGLVWLAWRASQTKTAEGNTTEAQKTTALVQHAAQAAADNFNSDAALEESLKNGNF